MLQRLDYNRSATFWRLKDRNLTLWIANDSHVPHRRCDESVQQPKLKDCCRSTLETAARDIDQTAIGRLLLRSADIQREPSCSPPDLELGARLYPKVPAMMSLLLPSHWPKGVPRLKQNNFLDSSLFVIPGKHDGPQRTAQFVRMMARVMRLDWRNTCRN